MFQSLVDGHRNRKYPDRNIEGLAVRSSLKSFTLVVVLATLPRTSIAGHPAENGGPIVVCTAIGGRGGVQQISDGRGGTIFAWNDERHPGTSKEDIYIQAIDTAGALKWAVEGAPLCTAEAEQYNVVLAQDAEGGAIAAWSDYRDPLGSVYAQRVDASGRTLWADDGINVAPSRNGVNPRIQPDGFGGALIAWETLSRAGREIHAQRVDAAGRLLWGAAGVPICTVPGLHAAPELVSDGDGGAIIAWTDMRASRARIFAQHVQGDGIPTWTADGLPVCGFPSEQRGGAAVSDGAGGAIIVWKDSRKSLPDTLGLLAQRVDGSGRSLWNRDGVDLCRQPLNDDLFVVASADRGGAIVAWHDDRTGDYDIYAQSVTPNGTVGWDENGIPVCHARGDQGYPSITKDQGGGVFVSWEGLGAGGGVGIQHLNGNGRVSWADSGIEVSSVEFSAATIAGDGRGGAVVAWCEIHRGPGRFDPTTGEVLARRILPFGSARADPVGRPASLDLRTGRAVLGVDAMTVSFNLSSPAVLRSSVFDLSGRRVRHLFMGPMEAGEHHLRWDSRDDAGQPVAAGAYFIRIETAGGSGTVSARVLRGGSGR